MSVNPLDWAGLAAAVAVIALAAAAAGIAMAIRGVRGLRSARRYKVRELADLDRGDIDPDWEQVRKTLRQPPGK